MNNFIDDMEKKNPFQNSSNLFDTDFELDYKDFDVEIPTNEVRLNDYDVNLLSNGAYKNIDNEVFKLEYKINRLEEKLKLIDSQLKSEKTLGETERIQKLIIKRRQYELELEKASKFYREKGLHTSLSDSIINFVVALPRFIIENLWKLLNLIGINQSAKIFNMNSGVKDALAALESINKNVDELVSMRSPYGESEERYNKLLKYLNKANKIQSQISEITKIETKRTK